MPYIPPILRQNDLNSRQVLLWIQEAGGGHDGGQSRAIAEETVGGSPTIRVPFWLGLSLLTVHTDTNTCTHTNLGCIHKRTHIHFPSMHARAYKQPVNEDTQGSCSSVLQQQRHFNSHFDTYLKVVRKTNYANIIISSIFKILLGIVEI